MGGRSSEVTLVVPGTDNGTVLGMQSTRPGYWMLGWAGPVGLVEVEVEVEAWMVCVTKIQGPEGFGRRQDSTSCTIGRPLLPPVYAQQ